MELLSSDLYFILVDGDRSLWVNRKTGTFSTKTHDYDELMRTTEATCLGTVYGFIGKLHYNESTEPRLAFIQKRAKVGEIKGCNIYCIRSIVTIPLETETELLLEPCRKAHGKSDNNNAASSQTTTSGGGKSKAFTSIEPVSGAVTSSVNPASSTALQKVKSSAGGTAKFLNFPSITKRQEKQGVDKIEKRMLDEFHKMFTEADSFYYSDTYDITNTVQRNFRTSEKQKEGNELPLWRLADSRFFWNIHLMNDLITSGDASLDRWILPIIQGFIQQEVADVNQFEMLGDGASGGIDMFVISRRSRFRAGTRYLRRGVDESGKVANYVETEQILVFKGHVISFVQVRGSIPVYWSQPGYKYRPPPRLDRSPDESFSAFTKHFEEEEAIYGPVTIVNLVEKNGKEKVLGDAYLDAVIRYDSPSISYFAFDFHEWCRGMRFENVSLLVEKLEPVLKNMNYTWVDSYGLVLRQEGVCRINCVDCLDRTNVVQTNLSKFMIVLQLSKLGLLIPDVGLPSSVKLRLQTLWANNGDIISKQYAGTNALKGDFTRTGERRLAGMMKDGMNSASRYYLNRFRDASRQAAIDIFLGVRTDITEDELDGEKVMSDEKENTAEQIRQVIDDVKRCIIPAADVTLGAWGFVNAKTNEPDSMDIDTIFVLTASQYYVTEYDCDLDTLTDTQKIALKAIDSIEIGNEPVNQPSNLWSIFHSSNSAAKGIPSVRLYYEQDGQIYYHQFRSSNVRFFNNVIVPVSHNVDEMMESLRMFAEAVTAAVSAKGKEIPVNEVLVLAPKESSRGSNRIPAVATSWVHRYFSFGNENDVSDKQMTSFHSSSQNGSPDRGIKINRRASSAAQNQPEGCDATAGIIANFDGEIEERKGGAERGDELGNNEMVYSSEEMSEKALCVDEIDLGLSLKIPIDDKKSQLLKHSAQTPIEGYRNLLVPAKDLVLPSCGILSMHENNFTSSLTALLSAHELIVEMDGLPSPVTPPTANIPEDSERSSTLEDDVSRSSPKHSMSPTFNPENYRAALQRHRYSLPVPSLIISKPPVNRPITPEIKITEEPGTVIRDENQRGKGEESILSPTSSIGSSRSVTGKLHVTIPKRMTRSTDDVNRISGESPSSMMSKLTSAFGGGTPLRFGRIPANTISADNRATSDVDLFGTMVNMKGSHSDNTLRENPYKNPSATASASNKKELVLAPLGKFARGMQSIGANYFDPRKLKGTFNLKGAPKLENIGNFVTSPRVEHSREEITALQERVKGCKSLIVDV